MRQLALSVALTVAPVSAQTTWVVDADGGPGSQFTEIQPAVSAAQAGDIILVRPRSSGSYAGFTVSKGVAILGDPTFNVVSTTSPVLIQNVPAGQTLAIANGSFAPLGPECMRITNAQGHVHLQDLDLRRPIFPSSLTGDGLRITGSGNVTMTGGSIGAPNGGYQRAVHAQGSTVTIAGADIVAQSYFLVFQPPPQPSFPLQPGVGISVSGSTLNLSRTDVQGGSGDALGLFGGRAAISATNSTVTVAGVVGNKLSAGTGTLPVSAVIADVGSTIVLDIDLEIRNTSGTGGPFEGIGASQVITQRVVCSVDADGGQLGGVINTSVAAVQNDIVLHYLGFPIPPTATAYGPAWIDLGFVFQLFAVVLPVTGTASRVVIVPNDPVLRGLTVGFQAAHWNHVTEVVEMSNVADITVH